MIGGLFKKFLEAIMDTNKKRGNIEKCFMATRLAVTFLKVKLTQVTNVEKTKLIRNRM